MPPTSRTVSLRRAQIADAAAIAALGSQLGYPATEQAIASRLDQILSAPDQFLVVAEQGGQVSGWLQAHSTVVIESGFRVEIVGLIVAEHARRQGIGRALVAAAEDWALKLGAPAVVVRTNVTRTASHAFYTALNYAPAKNQTVYRKALKR